MSTATEERVEVDVDLEKTVPCGSRIDGECPNVAKWLNLNIPCGHRGVPLCDAHMQHDDQQMKVVQILGLEVLCLRCGGIVTGFRWEPL